MAEIKPIETFYNGYRFRSRLEARWAVFFDALGIKYEYEREGYDLGEAGWYLPDFWLPIVCEPPYPGSGYFVEIKPIAPTQHEVDKMVALSRLTKHACNLFYGPVGIYADGYVTAHHRENVSTETDVVIKLVSLCTQIAGGVGDVSLHEATLRARQARFEHKDRQSNATLLNSQAKWR